MEKTTEQRTEKDRHNNKGIGRKKRRRIRRIVAVVVLLLAAAIGAVVFTRGKSSLPLGAFEAASEGSKSLVMSDPQAIPVYDGEDVIILEDGQPDFNAWDLEHITGEHYSDLDSLGRCGVAYAMLDRTMMPTEERGSIGQVKPSGWVQQKYPGIVDSDPPYLYNRCHLIAYALTGQNANEKNLITGTRYMNATTMLPWEVMVMSFLDDWDGHVLYRITPYFKDGELVARGVEMEAYSVEDQGEGLCFHVFVYNVQPGITIDYATGESSISQ
jgi:DNA-entry nuclease